MTYFRGHRADPPDVVARRPGFHLFGWHPELRAVRAASSLPLSTNNRALLDPSQGGPGVLDQSDTSSCEGHAHAAGATLRLALAGTPVPLISPIAAYKGALVVSRQPRADGTYDKLSDDGTEPSLVLQGLREWGACSAKDWGDYPASSATICNEPTLRQEELSAVAELDGAYFIQSIYDQRIIDLMTALAAKFPVSNAIPASGPEFQNYSGGVLGMLSGPVDHANLILDFAWDGKDLNSVEAWILNSWNRGWGEGGMWRCNRQCLDQMQDLAVLNLRRVP